MATKLSLRLLPKAFVLALILFATGGEVARADASALFKSLAGSWRGSGDLTLTDGTRERITCRGYYVLKSANGLSLAILCDSPNYKVEIRSLLDGSGGRVRGTWEERTFNAAGEVSGSASANALRLSIAGAIQGSLSIAMKGRGQSVSISTSGTGFRTVSISLVRG